MLRGASAEAQSELGGRLDDVSGDDARRLGEELFGVAAVLRREASLRRVATDTSVEGEAKATLMGNVFGEAVAEPTVSLVKDAVRRRWTSGQDLPAALEHLGAVALVRSAGEDAHRISDELFEVVRLVEGHGDLRSALSDPGRTSQAKGDLLAGLIEGKVQAATLLLVRQAVAGDQGAVGQQLRSFQHVAAEALGEKLATVHAARPLGAQELDRLAEALGSLYGTTVHLQLVHDPALVGGVRVEIGDDVIDGTVASKLEDAQRKLAG